MADFGMSVTNNSNSVIISSKYKVMVFSERGSFNITSQYSDTPGTATVYFTKPIHTQEPPQIFFGNVSGQHARVSLYITILGGPGNWTGFVVVTAIAGGNLQNTYVEYVSCKYTDTQSSNTFGLQIWDANGAIVYSSQDRVVRYSKFAKDWTEGVRGSPVYTYLSNLTIDGDDFICVSAFDRGVTWFTGFSYAGLTILDNSNPTLYITANISGGGRWYPYGPDTKFCIPVCKFPIDRYHN